MDSRVYDRKLLTPIAFASVDPETSPCGGRAGDIHSCAFTTSFSEPRVSHPAIIAHEAAHIFAAKPHCGDGRMAPRGGKYATWFTNQESQDMLDLGEQFRQSTPP